MDKFNNNQTVEDEIMRDIAALEMFDRRSALIMMDLIRYMSIHFANINNRFEMLEALIIQMKGEGNANTGGSDNRINNGYNDN